MNPVNVPNSTLMAQLTELIAATNLYVGGKLHLFKTPVAFTPNMDVSAFTEADFTGYAVSSTVVFTAPFISPLGIPTITGGLKQFVVDAMPTIFNTIYGWYLTDAAGTVLLFWRTFDAPVNLSLPLQGLDVIPAIPAYAGN
jgi:hypothetical protein